MFKVVGKGMFSKEVLMQKLIEWGIVNPHTAIRQAEERGKVVCDNDIRILLIGSRA
jgi:hypothetical protein